MRRHPGVWVGSQAISRPSGRAALQERQNLCQSTGIALQAFASRGCRQRDAQHSAALPATKVDRRRAVVVGKARQIRPAGQYEPDCRCNQCRTLPAMGVGGADAGGQGTMLLAFHGLPPNTLLCSHVVVSYLATLPIHVWRVTRTWPMVECTARVGLCGLPAWPGQAAAALRPSHHQRQANRSP